MTTTTTPGIRVYPGLLCSSIEFFNGHTGKFKVLSGGSVKEFKDAPYSYHQILKEAIQEEPETEKILFEWYPKSELKRLIQFGSCRFGGLDFVPDVTDSKLQKGEYSPCAAREFCPGAGILCQAPRYNDVKLSFTEVKVLKALATTDTNENIAFKLTMPLGTFHLLKKKLYQKLGIQTKPEAALIARDLNLL
jgi:hypothetical protein